MDEFSSHLHKVKTATLFFWSFCLVGWALLVDYRPLFAGLMLGSCVSFINAQHLAWKVRKLADAAVEKNGKKVNIGFLTRASLACLAALIAIRTEHFLFSTTMVGLFFTQLVTLLLGIRSSKK